MSVQLALPAIGHASAIAAQVEDSIGEGFSAKAFAENFDVLVSVAGSTKLLKELVLQLAVRGRLLPDGGESAQSLVTQIAQQRARLAEQSVRLRDDLPPVAGDEMPYEVPTGWKWIRLGHLGGFLGGGTPSKSNTAFWRGPLPWVSPKDMKRPYIDDAEDHISMTAVEQSSAKLIPPKSVLFVLRGMILAHSFPVAVTTRQVTINQDMRALVLAMPELSQFVLRTMQAARGRVLAMVERSSHGTCRLDSERVEMLPIALPPLAEQKRIVAKVDQLMALCDELETRQTKKRETGTRLTKSALEALTTAETPEDFNRAWTRVSDNFDVLFREGADLSVLRALVLELAFRGSLVGQLPGDGTARELLDTVAAGWKNKPRKETLGIVTDDERPRSPDRWEWIRLGDIAETIGGVTKGRDLKGRKLKSYPYLRVANVQRGFLDLEEMKEIEIPEDELPKYRLCPGDILFTEGGDWDKLGRSVVWQGQIDPCIHQNHVFRARVVSASLDPSWLSLFANSPAGRRYFENAAKQTTNLASINMTQLRNCPMPLPPLAEQRRIVAKVDQLLKLCDALEVKFRASEKLATRLADALVSSATTSEAA